MNFTENIATGAHNVSFGAMTITLRRTAPHVEYFFFFYRFFLVTSCAQTFRIDHHHLRHLHTKFQFSAMRILFLRGRIPRSTLSI